MARTNGSSAKWSSGERADRLFANHATIDRSAVGSIDADLAQLERAAVNRLRASQATIDRAAIGFASFDHGTLRQSAAGVVVARSIACDEVRVGILAAPVVRGEVHTWLDLRSAFALGVGIVLARTAFAGGRALLRRGSH